MATLEKAVRKGLFRRQEELQAGEKIRQTKLEINRRSVTVTVVSVVATSRLTYLLMSQETSLRVTERGAESSFNLSF